MLPSPNFACSNYRVVKISHPSAFVSLKQLSVMSESILKALRMLAECNAAAIQHDVGNGVENIKAFHIPRAHNCLRPGFDLFKGCCLLLDGETWLPLACIEKRQRSLFRQKSITVQKQLCVIQPSWKQDEIMGLLPEWLYRDGGTLNTGVLLTCHILMTIIDIWMM